MAVGVQTNQEIGELFGLTPSAVSRRVSVFKDAVNRNDVLRNGFDQSS